MSRISLVGVPALLIAQRSGELEVMWLEERREQSIYCKVSMDTPELVALEQLQDAAEALVSLP